jgi:ATP-binding cassette subfamily C exporter for protease/lipase
MNNKAEIWAILKSCRLAILTVGAFSAVLNVLMLAPSVYMLQIYDRVISSRNETTLLLLTGAILLVYLVVSGLELLRTLLLNKSSLRLAAMFNEKVFASAYRKIIETGDPGVAAQMIRDFSSLRQFINSPALLVFFDLPWFPFYLIVVFLFEPTLGFFSLAGVAILSVMALITEKITAPRVKLASTLAASAALTSTNILSNAQAVEALGMFKRMLARWKNSNSLHLLEQSSTHQASATIKAVTKFVQLSLQSLVMGVGAKLVIDGKITSGMMIAASILVGRTLSPVQQLVAVWKTWLEVSAAYKRLADLLTFSAASHTAVSLPAPRGHITAIEVSKTRPNAKIQALKKISFTLEPGDCLGIMGPCGSGKTTIARLLVGLTSPTEGELRLDDVDLHAWDKTELGPHIGYLPQDCTLLDGTVAENIARFGKADDALVVEAAMEAGIHEMVLRLPDGYATMIGSAGHALSSGQRQKIGLARALYGKPSVLVFDEPATHLDRFGERKLLALIKDIRRSHRTLVLITHRDGILSMTNKLMVLRKGQMHRYGPTGSVLRSIAEEDASQPTLGLAANPIVPHTLQGLHGT